MQVLTFASQKGGSGKTTLSGHVAVQAERSGFGPVALIDTDPQESLSDWWNERSEETPAFVQSSPARLREDIDKLRELGFKLLVIDTPPAITTTISEVIRFSDLVVIPSRPSPHDLRAIGRTVEIAKDLGKPMVFVMNGANSRARITSEAAIALSQHGTLAPAVIHQRSDFAASMTDGRTVMEIRRSSRSATEVAHLWDYLHDRLNMKSDSTYLPPTRTLSFN